MNRGKVGIGVIGCGFVGGKAHVPSVYYTPQARLVAISDTMAERAEKLAHRYSTKYYTDYTALLKEEEIQGVIVSVPTPFHFKIASDVIEAGKHILLEMPLAPTVREVRNLKKAADKKGVFIMPSLNFRFTPPYVKAKELIDCGEIGNIAAICYREFIPTRDLAQQWPASSWAWDKRASGGFPDFTLSVWSIDLVRWLVGSEVKDVKWMPQYIPVKEYGINAYNTVGLLSFRNDVTAVLQLSSLTTHAGSGSRLEVFGQRTFSLSAEGFDKLTLFKEEPDKQEWIFKEGGPKVWGHQQMDEHFVTCVAENKKPVISVGDAIKAIDIAKKIVE